MAELPSPASPNLLIDIWKTLRDMSQQLGNLIGATTATGAKVDGLDERLQQVEKCVQAIPALEGRVGALEGKAAKALAGSTKPTNGRTATWERVVRLVLYAVVLGYALAVGYVTFILPKLQP